MKTKGKLRQRWGKLTDDDLAVIQGKRQELEGRLQQRYGDANEAAQRAVTGVDEKIREAGASPEQADAIAAALKLDLLGDSDGAREVLNEVLPSQEVDEVLKVFDEAKTAA